MRHSQPRQARLDKKMPSTQTRCLHGCRPPIVGCAGNLCWPPGARSVAIYGPYGRWRRARLDCGWLASPAGSTQPDAAGRETRRDLLNRVANSGEASSGRQETFIKHLLAVVFVAKLIIAARKKGVRACPGISHQAFSSNSASGAPILFGPGSAGAGVSSLAVGAWQGSTTAGTPLCPQRQAVGRQYDYVLLAGRLNSDFWSRTHAVSPTREGAPIAAKSIFVVHAHTPCDV
ncbi:hypothetical protein B0T24DRAFT_252365 [Lasiosphaeria ovina]|uniref:Uncharacterized protein n=1 Tax=Lasiosphaeria ovina TaxID=92902 RepID=A0AAE0N722_9PEZI|nr:hypothetical protein B0T24DRAFT_252365 [Lasiosphaeria ovina]